ncbi:MAG TPA: D-glycerate dehydrogenase, partial [bacterium]|nr:D-glycerate dehydrogenase [bacterium]
DLRNAVSSFDPEGLITLLSDKIDKSVITAAPRLKVISNYAVGFNNIDVKYCSEKGITVTNIPDVLTDSTADVAILLLLTASRRSYEGEKFTREGKFTGWEPDLFLGKSLKGKTFGVIGMGRIGRATAKRAKAFGLKIVYWNRTRISIDKETELSAEYCEIDDLIRNSHFISLHLPFVPELHHLIGKKEIASMRSDAILINTARGALVDEDALADALIGKRIYAAGFDVYENEPVINEKLFALNNAVLLPHIGSAAEETRAEMAEMTINGCLSVLEGKKPANSVN